MGPARRILKIESLDNAGTAREITSKKNMTSKVSVTLMFYLELSTDQFVLRWILLLRVKNFYLQLKG
jgi:hypothetical protein